MSRVKNSTYISISLSLDEKDVLDAAVAEAGVARNRFIRNWIETLRKPRGKA